MSPPAPECRPPFPADTPAEVVISRELVPGEHLIWTARPPRGIKFHQQDLIEALHAAWAAVVEFIFMVNIGGPLLAVIGGVSTAMYATRLLDRFTVQPRRLRRTWYGLTAERVVVAELVGGEIEVRSTRLIDVGIARLTERDDGSGVIDLYRPARTWFARRMKRAESPIGRLVTLELAADARRVYNLIRDARRAATAPGSHAECSPVLVESE